MTETYREFIATTPDLDRVAEEAETHAANLVDQGFDADGTSGLIRGLVDRLRRTEDADAREKETTRLAYERAAVDALKDVAEDPEADNSERIAAANVLLGHLQSGYASRGGILGFLGVSR